MITTDEARAELAQRIGHSLSEFIDDDAPLNERLYIMGAEHVLKKFGLVDQASRPITDDQIAVMAQFISVAVRDSEEPGFDAFFTARVALEAVRGAQ